MIPLTKLTDSDSLKRLQQQGPVIANIVLLVTLSYTLAQLTWLLFTPPAEISPATSVKPQPGTAVKRDDQSQKLITINNAHLFGKLEQTAPVPIVEDAPETKLNLVLRGVLAAQPMSLATAIISQGKNGAEQIYGMGDSVPGNATIEAIQSDRVILLRNGRHEVLKLPEESIGDESLQAVSPDAAAQANADGDINIQQEPGRVLGDIRRKILKDPTSFGEFAIPIPVSKNGQLQGYRLRPTGKGREMFSQFGLQDSDIITKINGIDLNNPTQGISALRKLSQAQSVDLTIFRNGAEMPLHFELR